MNVLSPGCPRARPRSSSAMPTPSTADARREAMLEAALDCIVTMDADGLRRRLQRRRRAHLRLRARRGARAPSRRADRPARAARAPRGGHPAPPRARARARSSAAGSSCSAMRRDGSRIPVELTVTRSDVDGEPLFIGFLRDLSGLRATQAALEDAEARFRRLVEQVPVVTYICDYDEAVSIRYISPQIETHDGLPAGALDRGPPVLDLGRAPRRPRLGRRRARPPHPRRRSPSTSSTASSPPTARSCTCSTRRRSSATPTGTPLFSQGVLVDVTELRRTEARLRASEAQMSTIVESAPMVLFALDRDGVFTLSEGKALELLGLEPGEVVGRSVFEVYAGEPQVKAAARRALAGRARQRAGGGRRSRLRRRPTRPWRAARRRHGRDRRGHRRHRAPPQRAGAGALRLPRPADRARQPRAARGAPGVRGRARAARRARRSRCSTSTSTTSRPSTTRSAMRPATSCCARSRAGSQHRVAAAHLLARHGGDEFMLLLEDLPGDGRAVAEAVAARAAGGAAAAVPPRRRRAAGRRQRRHQPLPRRRAATRPTCSSTPTPRCTRPSAPAAAASRSTAPPTTARTAASSSPRRLRTALADDELELHFQPVFDLAGGRHHRRRGAACAGTTPSAGWSPRRSSSRWPRTPG